MAASCFVVRWLHARRERAVPYEHDETLIRIVDVWSKREPRLAIVVHEKSRVGNVGIPAGSDIDRSDAFRHG